MKKICIYGLGSIGGLIGARLASSGVPVNAIARGATFESVRRNGIELRKVVNGSAISTRHKIHVCEDPSELEPQDLVIISVKTTALKDIAKSITPLLHEKTTILSAMNGVPWWFFHGMDKKFQEIKLNSIDAGGDISSAIDPSRVIGCVTHLSASTPETGVVQHIAGNRIIIGEPSGQIDTTRFKQLEDLLKTSGFSVESTDFIQKEIWFKLWGNMTVNPISALTRATADLIIADDYVRAFMSRCMREAAEIGKHIGIPITDDPEARHAVTRQLGAFRTSMLQDAEAGKQLELDALVSVVIEMARQLDIPTPNIDTLLGLSRLQARVSGLYPAGNR